jgi:DNA repair protein RadC
LNLASTVALETSFTGAGLPRQTNVLMIKEDPHYHGHRARLRERLGKDAHGLADYEVLELLLGYIVPRRDTKPLAKDLLARFGGMRGVFQAREEELRAVKGFGPVLKNFWTLWRECRARVSEAPIRERTVLGSPSEVADMAIARLGHSLSEEFWLVLVDNKNRLMAWEQVSRGTVDQAPVYPREVLSLALTHKASGVILVHNHPGGDPKPSAQDVEQTKRIHRAAQDLEVRLLDHLIVTETDYFSFQSQGML